MPLTVEIWSDVVCPWCYIGKRRFEAALEAFEHRDEVTVMWRSFELDPEAPSEAHGTAAERLAAKYGMSIERALNLHAEMTQRAAAEGLEFHFERARGGNTFDAHRMIHLAATYGHQAAAQERLMRAYFTDGEPISDHETLSGSSPSSAWAPTRGAPRPRPTGTRRRRRSAGGALPPPPASRSPPTRRCPARRRARRGRRRGARRARARPLRRGRARGRAPRRPARDPGGAFLRARPPLRHH